MLTPDESAEPQESQRQSPDIDGEDRASGVDNWGKLQCKVSGTTAQIYYRTALPQIQRPDDIGWTLPLVPLRLNSRQLLQGSNTLVPDNRETKTEENSQKNQRGTKKHWRYV